MISKENIKNWFKTGLKPTQEQFWAWMDSFWHKDEMIPISKIEGMQPIYNAINSQNTQLAKAKIYATGELQVFKFAGNTNNGALEIGDFVVGIVGNQFIRGIYIGGDIVSLASFNVYDSIEF